MNFEWDENKNQTNIYKHGVSFEEAKTVFYDEQALLEYDELHSEEEDRFRLSVVARKEMFSLSCIVFVKNR